MDCASEENLIRLRLEGIQDINRLVIDIDARNIDIYHSSDTESILEALESLGLGAKLTDDCEIEPEQLTWRKDEETEYTQRKLLWTVLIVNFSFFILEMTTGLLSKSMGLVADSLDMLADSMVYGLGLIAVGGSVLRKKMIAKVAGYFQMTLALIGFVEVIRRFFGMTDLPDFRIMIIVSILALLANGICLYILQKSRSKEVHMKASIIFTSNDVIINLGVISAAILVLLSGSNKPDLLVGSVVFILVMRGSFKILALSKTP